MAKTRRIDNNYKTIFSVLKAALFNEDLVIFDNVDYSFVYQEMMDQAILPISTSVYKKFPIDNALQKKWYQSIITLIATGVHVKNHEQRLTSLFDENGIFSSILKGSAAAMYYPEGTFRVYGDVDIIVDPKDFNKAADLMNQNGYDMVTGLYDNYRNVTYYYSGIKVELHRHFFEGKFDSYNKIIYSALPKCLKIKSGSNFVNVLPDLENGIILLEHFRQHIISELGFRQLIDWLMFVNSVCDDAFWNEHFKAKAQELGLEQLAKVAAALGQEYFGLSKKITWCSDVERAVVDELLFYLIDNGNFGVKVKKETKDRTIMNIMGRNRSFFQWLRHLHQTGISHWKLAQKYRFFRCFAAPYQIGRYIVLGIKSFNLQKFIKEDQMSWIKRKKKLFSMLDIE